MTFEESLGTAETNSTEGLSPGNSLNLLLGCLFALVGGFAILRTISFYENTTGGKVITTFYSLVFLSSLLRAICFFIPDLSLQDSYVALPDIPKLRYSLYVGLIFLGNLSVYSVFFLLCAYWHNILQKIDNEEEESRRHLLMVSIENERKGPMCSFFERISLFSGVVFLNLLLYVCNVYNSECMLLYDSVVFIIVPSALSIEITIFSQKIRHVLSTYGAVNANNTTVQAQRILAITVVANIFFTVQLALHACLAMFIVYLWRANLKLINFSSYTFYWNLYVLIKYSSEVRNNGYLHWFMIFVILFLLL